MLADEDYEEYIKSNNPHMLISILCILFLKYVLLNYKKYKVRFLRCFLDEVSIIMSSEIARKPFVGYKNYYKPSTLSTIE